MNEQRRPKADISPFSPYFANGIIKGMDQQPEQRQPQPLPENQPVVPSPVAVEAQATPVGQESVVASEPLKSEPMGRPQETGQSLEWQASEYVEHEKSIKWFVILAVVALGLVAVAVFLLKNYTFAVLIVVMAIAVAVWARRPANEMQYRLDASGVSVDGKFFAMHDFRSFGVMQEGAIYAVVLLPVKRLAPGVRVYFPEELGEQIVDILGASMPMEDIQPDWIDSITRKLNF